LHEVSTIDLSAAFDKNQSRPITQAKYKASYYRREAGD